jgi:hypothetical protein
VRSASNRPVGRGSRASAPTNWLANQLGEKKKNLPSLRTRTRLRESNEEGLLVLHIVVGRFDAVVHDRTVLIG